MADKKETKLTIRTKGQLRALRVAVNTMKFMHGSVVGDRSFPHEAKPAKCACGYGESIRILTALRKELEEWQ